MHVPFHRCCGHPAPATLPQLKPPLLLPLPLHVLCSKKPGMSEVFSMALQFCKAGAYMHSKGFAHCDWKMSNALLHRPAGGRGLELMVRGVGWLVAGW